MIFFLAILGLSLGSFLNVLIWRLNDPKAPKFWQGRSICPDCKHQLAWFDNIPLLSFLWLSGRCRYCRIRISWQYPAVEILTAAAFVFGWILAEQMGFWGVLGVLGIISCFIVVFFSDLRYGSIPDEMIVTAAIFSFYLSLIIDHLANFRQHLLVGIVSGGLFLLIVLVTKFKGMGLGDVKLAFLMGFLLGWPKIIVALWMAFVLGGTVALVLLILKKVRMSATIPLGPFLVVGLVISNLWTKNILHWLGF